VPIKIKRETEEQIQLQVCAYIRAKYPNAVFTSDASGLKMPIGQAVKWSKMKSARGIPDLILLEPRGPFCGLCIELKRSREELYKKNGLYRNEKHIQEQAAMLSRLSLKGYRSVFACGYGPAVSEIDMYMKQKI
jgi:hypothetical protein